MSQTKISACLPVLYYYLYYPHIVNNSLICFPKYLAELWFNLCIWLKNLISLSCNKYLYVYLQLYFYCLL